MTIAEAMAARTLDKPYVTRERWSYITEHYCGYSYKLLPTDSPDGCISISGASKPSQIIRRWAPRAEDLTADDWITVSG